MVLDRDQNAALNILAKAFKGTLGHRETSGKPEFLYHRGTLAWEAQPVPRATLQDLDREQGEIIVLFSNTPLPEQSVVGHKEYRAITGASENTALRDLDELVERGSLRALGKRRARHYMLP